MADIAIIGDSDTLLTFRLGGIDGIVAHDAASARQAVRQILEQSPQDRKAQKGRTKLLLVTQAVAESAGDLLDPVALDPAAPMVLEIPGFSESGESRPLQRLLARVLRIRS